MIKAPKCVSYSSKQFSLHMLMFSLSIILIKHETLNREEQLKDKTFFCMHNKNT